MRFATDVFRGLRARARAGIWVEGLAAIVTTIAVWFLSSFVLDRGLHLELPFRALLLVAGIAVLARRVARSLVRPLRVPLDDRELALAVERGDRTVRQALVSAVEFDRDLQDARLRGQSESLMRGVIDAMQKGLARIDVSRAIDRRRVVKRSLTFAAVVLALGGLALAFPDTATLWARRNLLLADVEWPRATWLSFDGIEGDQVLRVAERDDVTLRVRAQGVVPDQVELEVRFAGGDHTTRTMERTGDGLFTTTLASLLETATVVARGGDGETPPLRIELVARPKITDLVVHATPPAYIGAEERPLDVIGGEFAVPRGSTLRVTGRSTKPLATGWLVRDAQARFTATIAGDGLAFEIAFAPEASGAHQLEVVDRDDLPPAAPTLLYIRVRDDQAPVLDYRTRGIGSLITANARIQGTLKLRDDHGLGAVGALFRVMSATPPENGEKPPEPPFEAAAVDWLGELQVGATEAELELVFDLQTLMKDPDPNSALNQVRPDTLLSLRFDAVDRKAPQPNAATSDIRTLRVVTREKLLQELRRRQSEQRAELERVLQKEVEARAAIAEILSPTAAHADAPRAKLRIEQLARQQNALGKTAQAVAERYREILDEMLNNRLFEPNVVRGIESKVVSPLVTLALEDFPDSASLIDAFAQKGDDPSRSATTEALDALIGKLRRIVEQMERTEDLAAIVESLRVVIRTERDAELLLRQMRDAEGNELFRDRKDGEKKR
ncbi:MAG: hypothetical protein HZB39_08205 [Planctomycetes bacterium]|nr:hypothetical protein [Planctomycetota bacterium]